MTKKRDVLVHLSREELLAAADRLGVELPERRAREPIEEAMADSGKAPVPEVLADLTRDPLTEIFRALGLDDLGRAFAAIVAWIAGNNRLARAWRFNVNEVGRCGVIGGVTALCDKVG